MNTFCYVLTTGGRDRHAEMTRASVTSVRISNPNKKLVIVIDTESLSNLKAASHDLLDLADEWIAVEVPEGTKEYRNRWMKTQLISFVNCDAIFLDSDTLVRKPLVLG
jgi:hypothetical protein